MSAVPNYQLLDFGGGRKLERFGPIVLDRPAPAAEGIARGDAPAWSTAAAQYVRGDGDQGEWIAAEPFPAAWNLTLAGLTLELRPTPFGHLGLFPEQQENWQWIAGQVRAANRPLKLLNLFAYTGGSTLAAAQAGAEVVHIDAARNVVDWARRNAELSGLADAPIRWIAEDARRFVERELKRGNAYDAVILDPPSYGHGPKGEIWKLDEHLAPLLAELARLTNGRPALLLVTCHTPGCGPRELADLVRAAFPHCSKHTGGRFEAMELGLQDSQSRTLPCGACVRWSDEALRS